MSVSYRLETRKIKTFGGQQKELVYARTVYPASISFDFFTRVIAQISAVSAGDVKSVLDTLTSLIAEQLAMGHIVDLGDLGRMRPSVHSRSALKEEEFTSAHIRNLSVVFVPGKAIKRSLREASVMRSLESVGENKKGKKPGTSGEGGNSQGNSSGQSSTEQGGAVGGGDPTED